MKVLGQVSDGGILDCQVVAHPDTIDWIVMKTDARATGARAVQRLVEGSVARIVGEAVLARVEKTS